MGENFPIYGKKSLFFFVHSFIYGTRAALLTELNINRIKIRSPEEKKSVSKGVFKINKEWNGNQGSRTLSYLI